MTDSSKPDSSKQTPCARILLLASNAGGLCARKRVLELEGHEVISSRDPVAAMDLLTAGGFQMLVTDYRIQPIDGLALIKQIRDAKLPVTVVLISGIAETLGLTPENTGADAVLQKGANEVQQLIRTVKQLLNPPSKKPVRSQGLHKPSRSKRQ